MHKNKSPLFHPIIKQAKWKRVAPAVVKVTHPSLIKPVKKNASIRFYKKTPKVKPKIIKTNPQTHTTTPAPSVFSFKPTVPLKRSYSKPKMKVTDDSGWMGALSIGPGFSGSSGGTQTFYLQSDIQKSYIPANNTPNFVEGELFVGYQKMMSEKMMGQLGIAFAITNGTTLKGSILEDADPDLDNYFYAYQVKHRRIALKGKMLMDVAEMMQPYVHASIGMGYNQASNFVITPKIFEEVPAPPFTNGSSASFAYSVGLGIQKEFNHHYQLGLGYEFANWGNSQLGKAPGQTLNSGLGASNLYTNSLQIVLGYVS